MKPKLAFMKEKIKAADLGEESSVPVQKAFTYSDGTIIKTSLPIVNGVDITDYKKIGKSTDYFFDIPETTPGAALMLLTTGRNF